MAEVFVCGSGGYIGIFFCDSGRSVLSPIWLLLCRLRCRFSLEQKILCCTDFQVGLSGTRGSQWTHGLRGRVLWHQHPILLASDSSFPALPMNRGVAVHRTSTRTMERETFHSTALALLYLFVVFFFVVFIVFLFDLKCRDPQ